MNEQILIAGVDEVGRGPLAGPVVAAAVILPELSADIGIADSKKLTEQQREKVYSRIYDVALAVAVASCSVEEIDALNILQASLLAMQRAVQGLSIKPDKIVVDGNICPEFTVPAQAIVRGDSSVLCIAAASIIAKVTRDRLMCELDAKYPQYGLAQHKGYPTKAHRQALAVHGPCVLHRKSFKPVQSLLAMTELT